MKNEHMQLYSNTDSNLSLVLASLAVQWYLTFWCIWDWCNLFLSWMCQWKCWKFHLGALFI